MTQLHYVPANNPVLRCARCGKETPTLYDDAGGLGVVHGGGECYDCYVAHGHPACPKCGKLTQGWWTYCAHCGRLLKEGNE